jgi:hypothetical protein
LDYEYNLNRYVEGFNQSLTLRSSGRVGDGRFNLVTNSSGGTGAGLGLLRNGTLTFERPNGERLTGGDFGTGTDLEFVSATVRGASFQLPVGGARVTTFAGRAISGVLPSPVLFTETSVPPEQSTAQRSPLRYDTNIFGAYATFGPSVNDQTRPGLLTFSSGALYFKGPHRSGQMLAGGLRYGSRRARLQADFGFGDFKGTQRDDVRVDGAGLAADLSGSFDLGDNLTLQGRYAHVGANFLSPQSGIHDPVNLAAGGVTWRARPWLTASLNGSTSSRPGFDKRPGVAGQTERFVNSTLTVTPRGHLPSIFFSHTQSSTPQIRGGAFTLLNASKDFSRWRLFVNATRMKTIGPAFMNAQAGASLRLNESNSLQVSQSFGSRGSLGGTADWQTQSILSKRLGLSAGLAYNRNTSHPTVFSGHLSAALRLPRQGSLQFSYLQTQSGPTLLFSLRGSLLKKRSAERASSAPLRELNSYGSFSGRVYQDVDSDGRFEPGVDRPQADVKVRVDGNRYVVTDESGRFRIDEVKVGEHKVYLDLLSVRADLTLLDGPQQTATLPPGRDVIVDFRLVRTGRISGVVWFDQNGNGLMDEGEQPLADVRVLTAGGRDTLTDSNGVFVLGDLPPGEYAVLVDEKTLPEKTRSAGGSLTVKVSAGQETGDVKFAIIPLPPEVKRFPAK